MPKPLSESERDYIKKRLIEEGKYCLERYGVKKTTVDEIVRRANIPKGTFYLFYKSKELLLFDVFMQFHDEYQEKLMTEISVAKNSMTAERMTDIIFNLCKALEESHMLTLITSGELEMLFRKLPPEITKKHMEKDDFRIEQLVAMIPNMTADKIQVFSGALRGLFISMLYRRDIVGDAVFDKVLRVLIRGVAIQMFEGETK